MERNNKEQGIFLLKCQTIVDGLTIFFSVHPTLKSKCGVIVCDDLADLSDIDIGDEFKDQPVTFRIPIMLSVCYLFHLHCLHVLVVLYAPNAIDLGVAPCCLWHSYQQVNY